MVEGGKKPCLSPTFFVYFSKEENETLCVPEQHGHHDDENRYEVRPLKGQAIGKVR